MVTLLRKRALHIGERDAPMCSREVRVLADAGAAERASVSARGAYVAAFTARFGLPVPEVWCDRWWPATAGGGR